MECYHIIKKLLAGETVNHYGRVIVEDAKLYTLPEKAPLLIGAAVTKETAAWMGSWADGMITIHKPFKELKETVDAFRQNGGEGKPVFLNFTASWCISCLVNERVALSTDAVKKQFEQQGITYLKGDWTNRDPHITAFLKKFNRSGVPLYVFYPAGQADTPVELPQILTPDIVIAAVDK